MRASTKSVPALASSLLAGWLCLTAAGAADEPDKKPAEGMLVVVDNAGKEHKLKTWKFVMGTRHLSWLVPEAAGKEDKGKAGTAAEAGPEALAFSEGKAPLKKGIVTLVPLDRIRALEYDPAKETVTLRIAAKEDKDVVLQGLTGYVSVNVVSIEAQVDLGALGTATVKFQGGVSRGVRSIRFPAPTVADAAVPVGRRADVIAHGKDKTVHHLVDLEPLYSLPDRSLRVVPTLRFQKTVKLDPGKIDKMSQVGSASNNPGGLVFDVTLKDGQQHPLVLIERLELAKGKTAALEGLLGKIDGGYKLFPMQTIGEVRFLAE